MTKKVSKRILSVKKVITEIDTSPDTSDLGEYSDNRTSEYSIDRQHSEDCASVSPIVIEAKDKLERIAEYLHELNYVETRDSDYTDGDLDKAEEIIRELADEMTDCDCGGHNTSAREYRYFNPSFNYVTKDGKLQPGMTPDEVRKYVRQDYQRMEQLNNGYWNYIGIRAVAKIAIPDGGTTSKGPTFTIQNISSGGLYGVESDSEASYIKQVGEDELDNLKTQLKAIGFSTRAISKAFQSVEEVSE